MIMMKDFPEARIKEQEWNMQGCYTASLDLFSMVFNYNGPASDSNYKDLLNAAIDYHEGVLPYVASSPTIAKDVANNLRLLKIIEATKPFEDSLKATDKADIAIKEILQESIERERSRVENEMSDFKSKYGIKPPKYTSSQQSF